MNPLDLSPINQTAVTKIVRLVATQLLCTSLDFEGSQLGTSYK